MERKKLEALASKCKVDAMKNVAKTGSFPHPHDRIQYRMNIIIKQVKLGQ